MSGHPANLSKLYGIPSRFRGAAEFAIVTVLYATITVILLAGRGFNPASHHLGGGFHRLQWDYVDWNNHYWNIWEARNLFLGDAGFFFTSREFFPFGLNTLTLHGDFLVRLTGGFFALFTGVDAAFFLLALLVTVGNGTGGYLLGREQSGSRSAGFAAGLVLAFSGMSAWSVNTGNFEAGLLLWTCLFLLYLARLLKTGDKKNIPLAVFFGSVAVYSNYSHLFFLFLFAAILVFFNRRILNPKISLRITITAAFLAVSILPLAVMFSSRAPGDNPVEDNAQTSILELVKRANSFTILEYAPWHSDDSDGLSLFEFRNPFDFAKKLATGKDPISRHIHGALSPHTRELANATEIHAISGRRFKSILLEELNMIMRERSLRDIRNSAGDGRKSGTKEVSLQDNLTILKETYPDVFTERRKKNNENAKTNLLFWIFLFLSLFLCTRKAGPWIFAFGIFFLLSLGPYLKTNEIASDGGIPLPFLFAFKYIPYFSWIHFPNRIFSFALLAGAVAGCQAFDRIAGVAGGFGKTALTSMMLIIILVEVGTGWPVRWTPKTVMNGFYDVLSENDEAGAIIEYPFNFGTIDARYLFYQTRHGRPLFNGVIPGYYGARLNPCIKLVETNKLLGTLNRMQSPFLRKYDIAIFSGPVEARYVEDEDYNDDISELARLGFKYLILHHYILWEIGTVAEFGSTPRISSFLTECLGTPLFSDSEITVFEIDRRPTR